MRINQLLNLVAMGVLWLHVGAGCQQDPTLTDCKNGDCCWPKETNRFVRRLEGSRAGVLGSGFIFQDQLSSSQYGPVQSCLMCPVQADQINAMKLDDNMKDNVEYDGDGNFHLVDSTRAYPYQVWGTLYELTDIPKLTSAPVYVFRLDKAEKVH
ncbi:hypothetical protein [Spirosoma radiotolerans]|nr:hypothetical protein [Spirosoma radiotolerans]